MLLDSTFNPQDFFTPGSFTTLAGATAIVYMVCGSIQYVFNFSPKWLALVISMIISFIGAYIGNLLADKSELLPYLLAFFNGFLIFMTATGTNQLISNSNGNPQVNLTRTATTPPTASHVDFAPPENPKSQVNQLQRRSFNANWWKNRP